LSPHIIGITGGIASGKSFVASVFEKAGIEVISADKVYHDLILPNNKLWKLLKDEWGNDILDSDGKIDSKTMSNIVFFDDKALKRLNSITHPVISETLRNMFLSSKSEFLILEAPLLIESGYKDLVDEIWVVDIPEQLQIDRLKKRNGMEETKAKKIINKQLTREERISFADKIIDNSKSKEKTENYLKQLIKNLKHRSVNK